MGGGGHFNAAAFIKEDTTLEELTKELKFQIDKQIEK
jgi:c-di-AMP phosphodiesterase-like protein